MVSLFFGEKMGFTKLDSGIVDSSLWDENANVLKVFITFWTKSDPNGIVTATYKALYRSANLCDENKNILSESEFDKYLKVLLNPDPTSRTKENEGRRIIRLEDSKWLITTYKTNREYTYSDNPEAVRKREYRGTKRDVSQTVTGHSVSVSASLSESEDNNDLKIKNIIPPKIEWVTQYCNERKNSVIPQKWYDFYQSKNWMIGKNKMKDWQAAVRTWEQISSSQTELSKKKNNEFKYISPYDQEK
jgi:hypothetical protein